MGTNKIINADRDHVIDFTKGFLVITMVAYHTFNYYLYGYNILYGYVGYVTQAFIFYSGFMCGTLYFQKFPANKKAVYHRLTIRSLKLILLFFIINVTVHAFLQRNFNNQEMGLGIFFNNLFSVFFKGDDRIAAFAILLPIGYTLLISAPLIHLHKFRYILYCLLIMAIIIISIFNVPLFFNLACMISGIGGVFTGLIHSEISTALNRPWMRYTGIALLFLFLFLIIPFGFDPRKYFAVYFLYINLIIFNLHLLGGILKPSGITTKLIIKFGQYSLLLYLAQIFILQILKKVFDFRLPSVAIDHVIVFVAVNILLAGVCYLADYFRHKFTFIDKSYRFIFN